MARTNKQMERYNRLKEQGICIRCGKNPNDGTIHCAECHKAVREYYLKYRHQMTDYQYQKQRDTSLRWQREHREYYNEYARKWRAANKERCNEYHKAYMRKRRKEQNNGEAE